MSKDNERVFLSRIEYIPVKDKPGYFNMRPLVEIVGKEVEPIDENEFPKYGTVNLTFAASDRKRPSFVEDERFVVWTIGAEDWTECEQDNYELNDYKRMIQTLESYGLCEVLDITGFEGMQARTFAEWGESALPLVRRPFSRQVYIRDSDYLVGPLRWEEQEGQFKLIPDGSGGDSYILSAYRNTAVTCWSFTEKEIHRGPQKVAPQDLQVWTRCCVALENLPASATPIDCISDLRLKKLMSGLLVKATRGGKGLAESMSLVESLDSVPSDVLAPARRERMLAFAQQGDLADGVARQLVESLFSSTEGRLQLVNLLEQSNHYLSALLPLAKEQESYKKMEDELRRQLDVQLRELDATKLQLEQEIADSKRTLSQIKDKANKIIKKGANGNKKGKKGGSFEMPAPPSVTEEREDKELAERLSKQREELESAQRELEQQHQQVQERLAAANAEEQVLRRQRESEMRRWQGEQDRIQSAVLAQFEEKLQSAYASLAFDGAISSAMTRAAARYDDERKQRQLYATVLSKESAGVPLAGQTAIQDYAQFVADELCERAHRQVDYNSVANLMLCLAQGFITVLAGRPGTGKSSLVALIAHVMGLDNPGVQRYQEVAVERGWMSRRDLIGYYNPLTRSFESANQGMFTCLATLKAEHEAQVSDFPYLVLLDEANLSPIEHYWADFMGICDLKKFNRRVSLSSEYTFPIGQALRFVATINVDHTTEALSPRLLDRAWIIKMDPHLDSIEDIRDEELEPSYPLVPLELFARLTDSRHWQATELDSFVAERFAEIAELCDSYDFTLSPRTLGMVRKFCLAGKGFIDTSSNGFAALDLAVAQKVLPLLDGAGSCHREFLARLQEVCGLALPRCHDLLESMLGQGQGSMQYYRFLTR